MPAHAILALIALITGSNSTWLCLVQFKPVILVLSETIYIILYHDSFLYDVPSKSYLQLFL